MNSDLPTISHRCLAAIPLRCTQLSLWLLALIGCGTSVPELSAVKKQMAAEQTAVGAPVMNGVGMILVPVPAGEFLMGTPKPQPKKGKKAALPPGSEGELPQHKVKISRPFFVSIYEVTQSQYQQVMGESPWKGQPLTTEGTHVAASYISWDQANDFCKKLSELESTTYRLPTEAEWEYVCRAGTDSPFSFVAKGDVIGDHAWFGQNAYKDGQQYAHAVAQKQPNGWSLYDIHGNVWEWCSDFHGPYHQRAKNSAGKPIVDPGGPEKGRQHVWRGGGFADDATNLRSACRGSYGRVGYRPEFMAGFRVVQEMQAK